MPFKRILLPIDGSEHSLEAMEKAQELAALSQGVVTLLYCVEAISARIGGAKRAELSTEQEEEALNFLDPYQKQLEHSGIKVLKKVGHGTPAAVILDAATSGECDIIIMGTRGRSDFEGLFLGSVTHKVLQHMDAPVLVVRSKKAMAED